MIDEARTLELFGYTSDELKPKSMKHIVILCEECGLQWTLRKQDYHSDICKWCAQRGKYVSDETKRRNSEAMKRRPPVSEESRKKMRESQRGKILCVRQRMSAGKQGIPINEWDGFAKDVKYCASFNESCRERNRNKHGRTCFVCGKDESTNGQKLSVHHVDMSKSQGCDGEKWKLVPLCQSCHAKSHTTVLKDRIEYLFKYI